MSVISEQWQKYLLFSLGLILLNGVLAYMTPTMDYSSVAMTTGVAFAIGLGASIIFNWFQ